MRIAILSDIHANLVALDAVLRHATDSVVLDGVWCLGDTVGYGPQPTACIERLNEVGAVWVAGNHERAATGAIGTEDFNPDAAAAAEWTKATLPDDQKSALDALPEVLVQDSFTMVHGTLRWPIWEYLYSREAALAHLQLQETPFGLVGHTHVPMLVEQAEGSGNNCELYRLSDGAEVKLPEGGKIVLNPGSVGQPRDGDPRAAYAIYDTEGRVITLHRAAYEISATQKLMKEARLPRWLIDRLQLGR